MLKKYLLPVIFLVKKKYGKNILKKNNILFTSPPGAGPTSQFPCLTLKSFTDQIVEGIKHRPATLVQGHIQQIKGGGGHKICFCRIGWNAAPLLYK